MAGARSSDALWRQLQGRLQVSSFMVGHWGSTSHSTGMAAAQTGLAAGALALNEEYICIQQAVFAAGGQAKIELTPEVTPLSATWYLALGRTLFAVLCVAQTSNVVVGALQQARFHQSGMEIMTRAVVGMEMFSQIMFLVKILNGPGCARDLCLRDSSFLPQARCIPK